MWFKQATFFQLPADINLDMTEVEERLQAMAFSPCLPTLPTSKGWVSPLGMEEGVLAHANDRFILICMQLEEKVLPATVVRQEVAAKIKALEAQRDKRVSAKERQDIKDEMVYTLLPRAFSKFSKVYAMISREDGSMIIDCTTASKLEKCLDLIKRTWQENQITPLVSDKVKAKLTHWLLNNECPRGFDIEKSAVLCDPEHSQRVIRCQQQDLMATPIRSLIRDGCEVIQCALSWQDKLRFSIAQDFSLRTIRYSDAVLEAAKENYSESDAQRFDADFFMMSELLSQLMQACLICFEAQAVSKEQKQEAVLEAEVELV